jgi:hypothetical protein
MSEQLRVKENSVDWTKLLISLGMGLIVWYLWKTLRARPDLLKLNDFNKSFRTLLGLAFILVAFVGSCALLLKTH